jgi:hypothetical protein
MINAIYLFRKVLLFHYKISIFLYWKQVISSLNTKKRTFNKRSKNVNHFFKDSFNKSLVKLNKVGVSAVD